MDFALHASSLRCQGNRAFVIPPSCGGGAQLGLSLAQKSPLLSLSQSKSHPSSNDKRTRSIAFLTTISVKCCALGLALVTPIRSSCRHGSLGVRAMVKA